MEAELQEEEQSIRSKISESERVLAALEEELGRIESERTSLAENAGQYELVERICESLQELDDMGAASLFWDEAHDRDAARRHTSHARASIVAHSGQIADVDARHQSVLRRIGEQSEALDVLHYELRDVVARNESRMNEWLVEREAQTPVDTDSIMPWSRGMEEDQRFRRLLAGSVVVSTVLALIVSAITIPIVERSTREELPERVAQLVRKEVPPPAVEQPAPVEEEEPEPEEPEVAEEQPEEKQDVPEQKAEQSVAESEPEVREKVKAKGILAFRESFASRANMQPEAKLGSNARLSNAGEEALGRPERMMVATSAPGSSGGIDLASISRDVGGAGGAIEGVEVARVSTSIGGAEGADRPLSAGAEAGRTDEEIQIVFDRYKAALYRLYNRALRNDPTLRGQLVLRLTIEPDGSVSMCALHNSDMDAPALADQVIERVKLFDFGAKEDVGPMTIIYPIDFLPAV